MRNVVYMVLLSIFLHACATTRGYEKVLQTWIGNDVNELMQEWGAPENVYKLPNGNTMYTWWFDGGAVAMPMGNMAYAVSRSCKTTFTTNAQGIIQTWRFEGNMCRQ